MRWKIRKGTKAPMAEIELWLADYCCRCGKLFANQERVAIVRLGETARPTHRDCTSREDAVLMTGEWRYHELDQHQPRKP